MEINHLKAVAPTSAAALVKPTKETMSKKSKKPVDTVKIRLQHPQEGNDFDVVLVNHEGEPVCNLCEKTFVTMKSLYDHLTGHSDVDWMTFFVPHSKIPTFDNEAKVVDDSMEAPLKWKLTGKRGSPAAAVAADHNNVKVYKQIIQASTISSMA
ncbi:hypothetical protein L2E82_12108 [Cichorium intybus]|uniref:Uncharacterized protein n=1 Tax=Cichorium intybus TaxID=13427 RepID=A0ACB9GFW0_CICIN|nr:hypothetical protein L2E82_12108 [Cichorium intybus]